MLVCGVVSVHSCCQPTSKWSRYFWQLALVMTVPTGTVPYGSACAALTRPREASPRIKINVNRLLIFNPPKGKYVPQKWRKSPLEEGRGETNRTEGRRIRAARFCVPVAAGRRDCGITRPPRVACSRRDGPGWRPQVTAEPALKPTRFAADRGRNRYPRHNCWPWLPPPRWA